MKRLILFVVLLLFGYFFVDKIKADTLLSPAFVNQMQKKEIFIVLPDSPDLAVSINKKNINQFLACLASNGRYLTYRITENVFKYENSVEVYCLDEKPVIKRIYM